LKENLYGGNLELSKQFDGRKVKTELKAGAFYQHRDRSFYGRNFVYNGAAPTSTLDPGIDLGSQSIDATKLYLLEKTSDAVNYYDGKSQVTALYAMADQRFFEKLRAVYGVRYEDADIRVTNFKTVNDVAHIQEGALLPSVNLAYSLSQKANLRAAYYASVNRPEFRELAPFTFYIFDRNADIKGNEDLKIAELNNYDLRLEFYPSGSQVLSVGGFYKTITNPVEFNIDISQPTFTTFIYSNEKSAKIYGLEFEVRKNLDFINDRQIFQDISVFSNLALIKSTLDFEAGSQAKTDRPLQGQSPYVINAGIQYENADNGWFGSVIINRVGRRIAYVGVDPKFGDTRQDIFEAPRSILDAQVGKNFGNLNLKFTLGDLFHQDQIFYQDTDQNGKFEDKSGGDRQLFRYTNGLTASLSVGYTFK